MSEPIVRQIDHVYVALDDAETGFAFLSEKLGLPVAWPYSDYGLFGSGGVSFGNVNVETLKGNELPMGRVHHPARITGIAFEPAGEVDDLIAALDERGTAHSPPMPYIPEGETDPFWTNVVVAITDGTFFCKYHFDVPAQRKLYSDRLKADGGGALGIVGIAELVIGTADLEGAAGRWQAVLDPLRASETGCWKIGNGPAVRLVGGEEDRVEHLVLEVRSVDEAVESAGALRIAVEDGPTLVPDALGGLRFVLREG